MTIKVLFIERKPTASVSIERVFRVVASGLDEQRFDVDFQSVEFGYGIKAIVRNLLFFKPRPADIYHVTGDIHYISAVLPSSKTVLTIHDLVFLHYSSGLKKFLLKKLFLELPLRKLRYFTTPSEATRREVVQETAICADRLSVIENPLPEGFAPKAEQVVNDPPVVLHIGTAFNKNLETVIDAITGLKVRLKIIGRLTRVIEESLLAAKIDFESDWGLDSHQMRLEYEKADVVEFCSTYEGFGLPIIEAQASGTPVLTSNLAPMSTVAGKGAALADPFDAASIRSGLERLFGDADHRRQIIQSGFENIKRFDRRKISDQYAELYKKIMMDQARRDNPF